MPQQKQKPHNTMWGKTTTINSQQGLLLEVGPVVRLASEGPCNVLKANLSFECGTWAQGRNRTPNDR